MYNPKVKIKNRKIKKYLAISYPILLSCISGCGFHQANGLGNGNHIQQGNRHGKNHSESGRLKELAAEKVAGSLMRDSLVKVIGTQECIENRDLRGLLKKIAESICKHVRSLNIPRTLEEDLIDIAHDSFLLNGYSKFLVKQSLDKIIQNRNALKDIRIDSLLRKLAEHVRASYDYTGLDDGQKDAKIDEIYALFYSDDMVEYIVSNYLQKILESICVWFNDIRRYPGPDNRFRDLVIKKCLKTKEDTELLYDVLIKDDALLYGFDEEDFMAIETHMGRAASDRMREAQQGTLKYRLKSMLGPIFHA